MLTRLFVALGVLACVLPAGPARAEPLAVVAAFSILGDMVRQVGGDQVRVITLVGPNSDAHGYQPTPADARAVAGADLVVVNGLGLDTWLDRLIQAAGYKGRVVVASQGVTPIREEDEGKAKDDPHAWQDIANGRRYAATIAKGLGDSAPDRRAGFEAGLRAYDRRLADLDAWVRTELAAIPREKRRIITSHDAFGYFGKAYGIDLLAPVGLSTDAEPTPKGIARLIQQIKAEHIKALFFENMVDPRLVRQLARDAGAVVGGTLYSDSLSAPDGPAATYEAMFRHNIPVLVAAMKKN